MLINPQTGSVFPVVNKTWSYKVAFSILETKTELSIILDELTELSANLLLVTQESSILTVLIAAVLIFPPVIAKA